MNSNLIDMSMLTFDDTVSDQEHDNEHDNDNNSSSTSNYLEKGLCVPQDRLEDLDFFLNFDDDVIRLDHDHDHMNSDEDRDEDRDEHKYNVSRDRDWLHSKKPRSKISRKRNRSLMNPRFKQHGRKRCSHCQAEETPQWRAGPAGRNTLCNACGLRYNVGRLVSNYRPAASPSFDCTKHSNYYKRLMRKKSKTDEMMEMDGVITV